LNDLDGLNDLFKPFLSPEYLLGDKLPFVGNGYVLGENDPDPLDGDLDPFLGERAPGDLPIDPFLVGEYLPIGEDSPLYGDPWGDPNLVGDNPVVDLLSKALFIPLFNVLLGEIGEVDLLENAPFLTGDLGDDGPTAGEYGLVKEYLVDDFGEVGVIVLAGEVGVYILALELLDTSLTGIATLGATLFGEAPYPLPTVDLLEGDLTPVFDTDAPLGTLIQLYLPVSLLPYWLYELLFVPARSVLREYILQE